VFKFFNRYWLKPAVFTILGEVSLLTFSAWLAFRIRFWHRPDAYLQEPLTWVKILTFVASFCIALYFNDLYDFSNHFTLRAIGVRVVRAATFAALGLWAIYYVLPALFMGRGVLGIAFLVALPLLTLWRLIIHKYLAARIFPERVILIGSDSFAKEIAEEILSRKHLGYNLLGFLDDDPSVHGVSIVNPKVLGGTELAPALAMGNQATKIVVAPGDHRGRLNLDALLECKTHGIPVEQGADFLEKLTGRVVLDGPRVRSWLIYSQGFVISRSVLFWKRALDSVVAFVLLFLSLPVMAAAALLIRLGSPGSILFRQERVGRGGRVFTLWKFRSMHSEAEAEIGAQWAAENDTRVTTIGRLIRKTRIDELPQLWNVLRGDMSLVGPRPERPEFVRQLTELSQFYELRLAVRPGLTGWAQIRAAYAASMEDSIEKLKYDLYYIKNLSIFLDLSILASTVRIVTLGKGAR
jgi:sugar transferase (PEP-CTERM system associated)